MNSLLLALVSGEISAGDRAVCAEALRNRGFELFTELRLAQVDAIRAGLEDFESWHVLVAFNPLMTGANRRPDAVFADFEIEKAAHLLANLLDDAPRHLRIAPSAEVAAAIAAAILPEAEMRQLQALIATRRDEMATDLPVLADLSRFKYRAKVELVEWNGAKAVKKTFRSTAHDAMERELAFFDDIAPHSDVPARVLARTENAIFYEHIENRWAVRRLFGFRLPLPLSLPQVRALAGFVRLVVQRGWDPIDLSPRDNILIDAKSGRLRAIDFEFAHRRARPVAPVDSYVLSGVPADAIAARPLNNAMDHDPYPGKWRPFTGLSKQSFLHDPAWLQWLKRLVVHPAWLAGHALGAVARRRKHAVDRDERLSEVVLVFSPPPRAPGPQ